MSEHFCKDCKNDGNNTCKFTGAVHTTGIECPSFEIKEEVGMEIKDTNPKDALGIKKAPLHSVPTGPLFEVGLAFMEGARKYGSHNYREVGVRSSVYYDAVMRHVAAWWEGEDVDPDSGVPHIIKAIASLIVLRDSMLMHNCNDDRPIRYPGGLDLPRMNHAAAEIIEKYPDCVAPFIEKNGVDRTA